MNRFHYAIIGIAIFAYNGAASAIADDSSSTVISRFVFIKPHEKVLAGKSNGVPDVESGELLLETSTGRFVYRYWYDGVDNKALLGRDARKVRDKDELSVGQYKTVLRSAAGFDGRRYWIAFFPQKLGNAQMARVVNVANDLRHLSSGCVELQAVPEGLSRCWWHHAILHGMTDVIGATKLERREIISHLAGSCSAKNLTEGVFEVNAQMDGKCDSNSLAGRWWRYTITMDESAVGLASVRVVSKHELPSGLWPFPVPRRFEIRRHDDHVTKIEVFGRAVNPESYVSDLAALRKLD